MKGLKKVGAHYLAAGAVRFPELHPLLERYADLAMVEYHWLLDLDEEDPALPGTFAVFALALSSPDYFPLLDRYLTIVDDEHQYVHTRFAVAFVERYGITERHPATLPEPDGLRTRWLAPPGHPASVYGPRRPALATGRKIFLRPI